jgi:hypothetical protein
MKTITYISCSGWFCLWPNAAFTVPVQQDKAVMQLVVNPKTQPAIQFEARQASLKAILNQFAEKTGAIIHFSVLPEEPVTATCAGDTVKQVMECLLGSRVDRIYRKMPHNLRNKLLAENTLPKEEIWILGARYGNTGSSMSCTLDDGKTNNAKKQASGREQTPQQALMKMAQIIDDPRYGELGKQALSMLAAAGKTGDAETDAEITQTLENALKDKNPEARVQAVYGLIQQDKTNTEVLHEALQDNNADVRLMAVDSAKTDSPQGRAILHEALTDTDETIRSLAEQKLNAVSNAQ